MSDLPLYEPAPPLPASFLEQATVRGGINLFGQPRYRLVWSRAERDTIAGVTVLKYASILGAGVPRCWIIESWEHPGMFGNREDWEQRRFQLVDGALMDVRGPFPREGRYCKQGAPLMSADGAGLSTAEACAYALEQISFFAYHRDNSPLLPDGGLAESDKRIAHKERLRAERVEKEAQALEDYTVANWHDLTKSRATTSGAAAGLIEIVQPGDVNRRIQTL